MKNKNSGSQNNFVENTRYKNFIRKTLEKFPAARGHSIVLGDFNEWTRGLTTQLLRERFSTPDVRSAVVPLRDGVGITWRER